jgi:predicted dienelactone hydrolase
MIIRSILILTVCLAVAMLGVSTVPLSSQETQSPLLEPGPNQVGRRILEFVDESRDNRPIEVYVWYPAVVQEGLEEPFAPDSSGAPYPLIIHSHGLTAYPPELEPVYLEHLVSYGFVVAAPDHQDNVPGVRLNQVDRPLDVLFTLNALTDLEDDPLADIMDTENVGLLGSSMGAYTVIAAGGARVDYAGLSEFCTQEEASQFGECRNPDRASIDAYNASLNLPEGESLWPVLANERIKAVMAVAPCSAFLFGDRGLAAMTVPVLFLAGTADTTCDYQDNAAYSFERIGSIDRYLVSVDGASHYSIAFNRTPPRHLTVAFFGYYLQGNAEYAEYLTPQWVETLSPAAVEVQAGGS